MLLVSTESGDGADLIAGSPTLTAAESGVEAVLQPSDVHAPTDRVRVNAMPISPCLGGRLRNPATTDPHAEENIPARLSNGLARTSKGLAVMPSSAFSVIERSGSYF